MGSQDELLGLKRTLAAQKEITRAHAEALRRALASARNLHHSGERLLSCVEGFVWENVTGRGHEPRLLPQLP